MTSKTAHHLWDIKDAEAWATSADLLARWTIDRLVNRDDRYGGYYQTADGTVSSCTVPKDGPSAGSLTSDVLVRHYRASNADDVVGLHALSPESRGKWVALDIDAHDGTPFDADANRRFAEVTYLRLTDLGLCPLLVSSNGQGGYHLYVLFHEAVDGWKLLALGRWLTQGHRIEIFPKQPCIADGLYGNFLRLPGRHHKRPHWSEVFDGTVWQSGSAAVRHVLSLRGSVAEIPPEALVGGATIDVVTGPRESLKERPGDAFNRVGSWDETGLFEAGWVRVAGMGAGHTVRRPGKTSGTSGTVGVARTETGLELLHCFSDSAPPLEAGRSYTKFATLAVLKYEGDFAAAARFLRSAGYGGPGDSAADSRPTILIDSDEHRVNDEAVAALSRDLELYQRGSELVLVDQDAGGPGRDPSRELAIRVLERATLRERLTRVANFRKPASDGKLIPASPPRWCVDAVAARGHWPSLRRITAVVTHPFVAADGTVNSQPGYHARSGILLDLPPDLRKLSIADSPTAADVREALSTIYDVVADFPFATAADRSAWLAAFLTPIMSFAIDGNVPLFLVDGNVRGVGKGLLLNVIAVPLTGRSFSATQFTSDREETRKTITSLSITGDRFIMLDNVSGTFGNSTLDSALTTRWWKDRRLGQNATYEGPLDVIWYATGNNVQLGDDIARRVCPVRLETPDELPELKATFRYPNLLAHVALHRPALVRSALIICRAWFAAGQPRLATTAWGSFDAWSDIVRSVIIYAGEPDPAVTRAVLRQAGDREAETMKAVVRGLALLDSMGHGLTISQLLCRVMGENDSMVVEMRTAIEELCPALDARTLGYHFRKHRRRNFAGLMLDTGGTTGGSSRWRAVPVDHRESPRGG